MVAQSIAWAYAPGNEPHTEESPLDLQAEGPRALTIAGVLALENAVLSARACYVIGTIQPCRSSARA